MAAKPSEPAKDEAPPASPTVVVLPLSTACWFRRELKHAHDAAAQLAKIKASTQITFGCHDLVTSTRFADAMTSSIATSEMLVFEDCSHAPIYENVAEFNAKTLAFLGRQMEKARHFINYPPAGVNRFKRPTGHRRDAFQSGTVQVAS